MGSHRLTIRFNIGVNSLDLHRPVSNIADSITGLKTPVSASVAVTRLAAEAIEVLTASFFLCPRQLDFGVGQIVFRGP
jgi:hypothetical protein